MKITRFQDVPHFTRAGSWECDFRWDSGLSWIEALVVSDGLEMNPDFQRLHVWIEAQQIAYLEFFLRGGKTGRVIYINHPGWKRNYDGKPVLVDGKQRLEAFRRFRDNEIKVFGSYFSEYTDKPSWADYTLKINVNDLTTEAEVVQWYIDMNAGGTPHTKDEIEKAKTILSSLQDTNKHEEKD